jgi:hypothetical protein
MLLLTAVMAPTVCLANADKVFKENYKAVVTIITFDRYGSRLRLGSGFIAKSDGTVITNRHVIEGARIVKVKISNKWYKGRPVYIGKSSDVAIIKVDNFAGKLPVVQLGDSTKVTIGEKVYVIGNPAGLEKSLSDGIISGIRRIKNMRQEFIQFTAPISPGSSGGPVFNKDGQVIGIATASMDDEMLNMIQNLNLATPIEAIKQQISGRGNLKSDTKTIVNRLFNHKGMLYFFLGIVMLFILCKLDIVNKWLDFLHTLQHELVHIAVAGMFGGAPVAMEVTAQGGAAYTTKSNFIVRLSPYVMPLFSFLIMGISFLLDSAYKPVAFVLAGLFYGNFIVKTASSLNMQPDIQKSGGRLITFPLIFIINVMVLAAIGRMVQGL